MRVQTAWKGALHTNTNKDPCLHLGLWTISREGDNVWLDIHMYMQRILCCCVFYSIEVWKQVEFHSVTHDHTRLWKTIESESRPRRNTPMYHYGYRRKIRPEMQFQCTLCGGRVRCYLRRGERTEKLQWQKNDSVREREGQVVKRRWLMLEKGASKREREDHTSTMSPQRSPGSRRKASDVVLSCNKSFMTGRRQGLLCILDKIYHRA